MNRSNRYDEVADVYDAYGDAGFDLPFFRDLAAESGGRVLDVMAGTGRVSLGIAAACESVIALERSAPMLHRLREKARPSAGRVFPLCGDARAIPLRGEVFDLVLIPFNSFTELLTESDRRSALREIFRCLTAGGRLVATLHNPEIRARTLDGERRLRGRYPVPGSPDRILELWVEGSHDRATGIAESRQVLRIVDRDGELREERRQTVRFALLDPGELVEAAEETGLRRLECFGGYDRAPFDPEESPYHISVFTKARGGGRAAPGEDGNGGLEPTDPTRKEKSA